MVEYLSRKVFKTSILNPLGYKVLPTDFLESMQSTIESKFLLPKYKEVSHQIRKVTYNTDYFNKTNFENRANLNTGGSPILPAFHFNSGRIGKFIECEFENPVEIVCTGLIIAK